MKNSATTIHIFCLVSSTILLRAAPGLAHNSPSSAVMLDFHRDGVAAELTLPLAELELSFKHPLLAAPGEVLFKYQEALEEYVLAHVKPEADDGRKWIVELRDISVQVDQQPLDLLVKLWMKPPAHASVRKFNFNYSVINHEVMSHKVNVSVRRDWNTAVFPDRPEELGCIYFTITSLKIDRANGSWWRGARAAISRVMAKGRGWWLLALMPMVALPLWKRREVAKLLDCASPLALWLRGAAVLILRISRTARSNAPRSGAQSIALREDADGAGQDASAHCGRVATGVLVAGLAVFVSGKASAQPATNVAAVVAAANAFLATLSASQSNTAVVSFTLANAGNWSNLPVGGTTRNGPQFSTLTAAQLAAALNVGTNALSARGATLFEEIRLADGVISQVNSSMWGYNKYYIAFVGVPSTNTPWMLQLGGHHMAYNVIFNGTNSPTNTTYLSATPQFTGTEPNTWTNGGVVYAPLGVQRSNIIALRTALTTAAQLSGTYSDVVFGPNGTGNHDTVFPKAYPTTGRGQLYSTLTTQQQVMVRAYIMAWVTNAQLDRAASLLADYFTDAALAQTYIGYSGSSTNMTTQGSYFRVDGPRVWIEFIDQGGVAYPGMVHDHGIWRDKLADYGAAFGTNTISTSERPPGITTQPVSVTNTAGSSASFSCIATGTAPIYFQWFKDGAAISGATNSSYNIPSIGATNAGAYFARVWNHMGIKTSSNATLAVTTVSAPTNSAPSYSRGEFSSVVIGPAGQYTIQATTNLQSNPASTVWETLFSTNSSGMPFQWFDPSATNSPMRFYRVLLIP